VEDSVVTGDKKKSGIIRKYGLNMSRQAFREKAQDIGFVKVCSWACVRSVFYRTEMRNWRARHRVARMEADKELVPLNPPTIGESCDKEVSAR
jgi:hypothetical protein